ncbi:MAG TPA: osmotically inducible protein C [bacterium]|nr:osmotically inducible protein C [bacterium]
MDMEITFTGGKKVDALVNGFAIKTDQPVSAGGEGSAPAPYELFLASIGTCAGIYILSFCQQRGISTENIKIVQKLLPNETNRGIGTIALEIQLPEDFPDQYSGALIRAAELCAVKKTIQNPPRFEIYTNKINS